jgi:hypothetical protein
MEFTSFGKAKDLKEAGFPQPKPQFGQIWYTDRGEVCVCISARVYRDPRGNKWTIDEGFLIYAPTATDILRHLPPALPLRFHSPAKEPQCFDLDGWYDVNSADACADCWFSQQ